MTALLEQLLDAHLDDRGREVLRYAAVLRSASLREIRSVAGPVSEALLESIAEILPLVRLDRGGRDGLQVVVHDLVAEYVWRSIRAERSHPSTFDCKGVLAVLAERHDWDAAVSFLQRCGGEREAARFLLLSGQSMLASQHYEGLLRLVGLAGLQEVMARPEAVYLWASALHETGQVEESLAKASAALTLAEHEGDRATLGLSAALRVRTLVDQGKTQGGCRLR